MHCLVIVPSTVVEIVLLLLPEIAFRVGKLQGVQRVREPHGADRASRVCYAVRHTAHIFLNLGFYVLGRIFNKFVWHNGRRTLLNIRVLYRLLEMDSKRWFLRFILNLKTFHTQKGRYLEQYFWSKIKLFCCNGWFKQCFLENLNKLSKFSISIKEL